MSKDGIRAPYRTPQISPYNYTAGARVMTGDRVDINNVKSPAAVLALGGQQSYQSASELCNFVNNFASVTSELQTWASTIFSSYKFTALVELATDIEMKLGKGEFGTVYAWDYNFITGKFDNYWLDKNETGMYGPTDVVSYPVSGPSDNYYDVFQSTRLDIRAEAPSTDLQSHYDQESLLRAEDKQQQEVDNE